MSLIVDACRWLATRIGESKVQLRLSLRVTVSAVVTLIVAQLIDLPLGGLWAVLTSVIVTQMSIGGSLKATIEYAVGTLGGAVYAGVIATILPPTGELASLSDLVVVVAPLALLAAFNPTFRVAPFTAVIVVVGSERQPTRDAMNRRSTAWSRSGSAAQSGSWSPTWCCRNVPTPWHARPRPE